MENPQAVLAVMDDYDLSVSKLEKEASVYPFCKSERLRSMDLRYLGFQNHRYLFIFRITDDDRVIVEGMYHELQDYENSIR